MAKNKSTLLKDALALFLITLVSGLALSFVYEITKAPIEKQAMDKKLEAYQTVYTAADSITTDEELMELAANTDLKSLNAAYKGVTIDEINKAFNTSGEMIGYIIKVSTIAGYKDRITLALGYSKEGSITGMEVLYINETAGLGMIAAEPSFKDQFTGKNVESFEVTKAGATEDGQINAISGATITSDAVVNAVNAGINFVRENATDLGGGQNE